MGVANHRQGAQVRAREPGRILQAAMASQASQAALSPVPTCHSCIAKFRLVLISRPIAAAFVHYPSRDIPYLTSPLQSLTNCPIVDLPPGSGPATPDTRQASPTLDLTPAHPDPGRRSRAPSGTMKRALRPTSADFESTIPISNEYHDSRASLGNFTDAEYLHQRGTIKFTFDSPRFNRG